MSSLTEKVMSHGCGNGSGVRRGGKVAAEIREWRWKTKDKPDHSIHL